MNKCNAIIFNALQNIQEPSTMSYALVPLRYELTVTICLHDALHFFVQLRINTENQRKIAYKLRVPYVF